ncbi:hypothetical protein EDC39_11076 [Geothermobacter ehrlichii]|uniref:Uncharacterized protein n=1 Tax=Geothermobacter ehrlichii TaxID=213224 RepID=A0A5D3WI50_9BACT|nr:hypothetical protein [Geothermobacter ehrlichii]TYO97536.1 hypothetical protein EDC39_11076 [Geothermobacter ehrlichii]
MYGKAVFLAMNSLFMLALLLAFLLSSPLISLGATEPELGLDTSQLVSVEDTALEQTRGRYFDFYFTISFTGYWRHDDPTPGLPSARLAYNFGMGTQQQDGNLHLTLTDGDDTPSPPSTPPLQVDDRDAAPSEQPPEPPGENPMAIISGGFDGSSGAFQITQVPGSDNVVTSGLAINLWMLNVQESATAERVRSALTEMLGMTQ